MVGPENGQQHDAGESQDALKRLLALSAAEADRCALAELYQPVLVSVPGAATIFAHLGQSLDGFIATESGDSFYVTGRENILHLHRMRALCDAVIVGAATVAADDPRLTTREVPGRSPLRVVLDPRRRLRAEHQVFVDGAAPTLLVCLEGAVGSPQSVLASAGVEVLELPGSSAVSGGISLPALVTALQRRGCSRLFVEGGGRTVSSFLQAGLLSRLHVAVAPLLIGTGRPGIRLPGSLTLADCLRAPHRIYRMGSDLLFDLELGAATEVGTAPVSGPAVQRIL